MTTAYVPMTLLHMMVPFEPTVLHQIPLREVLDAEELDSPRPELPSEVRNADHHAQVDHGHPPPEPPGQGQVALDVHEFGVGVAVEGLGWELRKVASAEPAVKFAVLVLGGMVHDGREVEGRVLDDLPVGHVLALDVDPQEALKHLLSDGVRTAQRVESRECVLVV